MTPPTQTARQRNKIAERYYRSQRKLIVEYWNTDHNEWMVCCGAPEFYDEDTYRIAPKKKGKG